MKLRLMVCYDVDEYSFAIADDGHYVSASNGGHTEDHRHTNKNFNSVLLYNVLSGCLLNHYEKFEYSLVDVPDELVFQEMMLGLQDGDYIAFNYVTKRIVVASTPSLARNYCSRDSDNDTPFGWKNSVSGSSNRDKDDLVLDFSLEDSPEEIRSQQRDGYYADITNMYVDVRATLAPYLEHKFIHDFCSTAKFLDRYVDAIGIQTKMGTGADNPREADSFGGIGGNSERPKQKMKICTDDVKFVFSTFINNDNLFTKTKGLIGTEYVEIIRQYTVDIMTKCTETTGSQWDL